MIKFHAICDDGWEDFSADGQFVNRAYSPPGYIAHQQLFPPDLQPGWPGLEPAIDEVGCLLNIPHPTASLT